MSDPTSHSPQSRTAVKVGDLAPALELTNQHGEARSLADLMGTPVVVYFFPKAFTPGCTTEVCSFRDSQVPLARAGYQLLGVSGDPVPVLKDFAAANGVDHDLLSDPGHASAIRWGAYGPKVVAGKDMVGPLRSTFVVDAHGRVISLEHDLDATTHVETLRRDLGA
ncbi:MAG: peroxiredoxin [Ornithinibacter sp.]